LWPNGWTDQGETWDAGRPRPWPHYIRWGLSSPSTKEAQRPNFRPISCGQMDGWIKMPLGRNVGLNPTDIVLDGNPAPIPQKGTELPQFSAYVYCGQKAGMIKMPLRIQVDLGPFHIVLDGDPALLPHKKKGTAQFWAHVCCGQTPGWMQMPLGTKIGLGPGDIVLHGDPVTPQKRHRPPIFRRCLL